MTVSLIFEPSMGLSLSPSLGAMERAPAQSFDELLQAVAARQEGQQALGFDEMGLFNSDAGRQQSGMETQGATGTTPPQSSAQSESPAPSRPTLGGLALLGAQLQAPLVSGSANPVANALAVGMTAGSSAIGTSPNQAESAAVDGAPTPTPQAEASFSPSLMPQIQGPAVDEGAIPLDGSPPDAVERTTLADKADLQVAVAQQDGELSVVVGAPSQSSDDPDALRRALENVSAEFGLKLGGLSFNGAAIDPVSSNKGGAQ